MVSEKLNNKQIIPMESCPLCKTKDSVIVSTKIKYLHYHKIPILPLNKINTINCLSCKSIIPKESLSVQAETFSTQFFNEQKIGWYYFVFFIVMFIGFFLALLNYLIHKLF